MYLSTYGEPSSNENEYPTGKAFLRLRLRLSLRLRLRLCIPLPLSVHTALRSANAAALVFGADSRPPPKSHLFACAHPASSMLRISPAVVQSGIVVAAALDTNPR